MSRRKTDEQFQKEFQEHGNKSIKILGQYVTQKTLIPVECRICGYKWNAWPDSLLRGSGCSKCANKVRLTDEEFAKKLLAVNPNIEIVGNYISTHKHIKIKCKICGHEWAAMPSNLLRNYGCPKCNGGIKQSTNAFLSRMKLYHHDIEVLGNYINSLTPITVKCRRCGNIWNAAPNSMLNGNKSGCPACAHNQSSFLEQLILAFCKCCFGAEKVLSRNRNIIGSELDIVVLGNNQKPIFAIEPGSWTLHKDNYEKDIKKIIQYEYPNRKHHQTRLVFA
jgi:predicted Zn-ribbon and HTH transcriptional regulator